MSASPRFRSASDCSRPTSPSSIRSTMALSSATASSKESFSGSGFLAGFFAADMIESLSRRVEEVQLLRLLGAAALHDRADRAIGQVREKAITRADLRDAADHAVSRRRVGGL